MPSETWSTPAHSCALAQLPLLTHSLTRSSFDVIEQGGGTPDVWGSSLGYRSSHVDQAQLSVDDVGGPVAPMQCLFENLTHSVALQQFLCKVFCRFSNYVCKVLSTAALVSK